MVGRVRSPEYFLPLMLALLAATIVPAGYFAGDAASPRTRDATWTNRFGMKFVLIPAGRFFMGAGDADRRIVFNLVRDRAGVVGRERYGDEAPVHEVRISHPFLIGQFEVTQAQWTAIMHHNPSSDRVCGESCPVENLSWDDAAGFIAELNRRDPLHLYRLPTEAEWEYAARGGGGPLLHDAAAQGWYAANSGDRPIDALEIWRNDPERFGPALARNHARIHPVGRKAANSAGLFDMFGNVWEWTADWYDQGYYSHSPAIDPAGPESGTERVLRGGAFDHNTLVNAPVTRVKFAPGGHAPSFGLRLAITLGS
jgi:formylglycine-generating enzyme required for sulfatase activity